MRFGLTFLLNSPLGIPSFLNSNLVLPVSSTTREARRKFLQAEATKSEGETLQRLVAIDAHLKMERRER